MNRGRAVWVAVVVLAATAAWSQEKPPAPKPAAPAARKPEPFVVNPKLPKDVQSSQLALHAEELQAQGFFAEAASYFQQAAEEDRTNHRAFEGLAQSYLMLALFGMRPPRETHLRFTQAHRRAVALKGRESVRSA